MYAQKQLKHVNLAEPAGALRQRFDVLRDRALARHLAAKLHALPLLQGLLKVRRYIVEVREQVLGSIVRFDESEALRATEPLHCACTHASYLLLLLLAGQILVTQVDFRADHL
jgi:hypothetical protein